MSRRTFSGPSAEQSYRSQLRQAMSVFLPHRGLPLLCDDKRVRWTSRMLAMAAVMMAWSGMSGLLDRFAQDGLLFAESEPGICRVVCFSPRHNLTIANMELADVRSIEVNRSLMQRIMGLGNVGVASAASADFMIRLLDIPDPERAFLAIDSGFPLLELEQTLQGGKPFEYAYASTSVPVELTESDWTKASKEVRRLRQRIFQATQARLLRKLYLPSRERRVVVSTPLKATTLRIPGNIGPPTRVPVASAISTPLPLLAMAPVPARSLPMKLAWTRLLLTWKLLAWL